MKRKMNFVLIFSIIAIILIVAFLLHSFVFSIYEVTFGETKKEYNIGAEVTIATNPINGMGSRAPLRDAPFTFEIQLGKEFIKVIKDESKLGNLVLKFTGAGKIKILIIPDHALKPTLFEFSVMP